MIKAEDLAVRYFRAAKTRGVAVEQLQAALEGLIAEYNALSDVDRNGIEGRAYKLAMRPLLEELSVVASDAPDVSGEAQEARE